MLKKEASNYNELSTAEQMAVDLRVLQKLREKEREINQQMKVLENSKPITSHRSGAIKINGSSEKESNRKYSIEEQ